MISLCQKFSNVLETQTMSNFPSQQNWLHLHWATLPERGEAVKLQKKQSSQYLKGSTWMVLLFESYMTLGKSLTFSEAQVAHLWRMDRAIDPCACVAETVVYPPAGPIEPLIACIPFDEQNYLSWTLQQGYNHMAYLPPLTHSHTRC